VGAGLVDHPDAAILRLELLDQLIDGLDLGLVVVLPVPDGDGLTRLGARPSSQSPNQRQGEEDRHQGASPAGDHARQPPLGESLDLDGPENRQANFHQAIEEVSPLPRTTFTPGTTSSSTNPRTNEGDGISARIKHGG